MITDDLKSKRIVLLLLKEFSKLHTITSLSKEIKLSRVGIWKILKKLQSKQLIKLNPVGSGRTSTTIVNLNLENILVDKLLGLYLMEEAISQRRWRINFSELEELVDFSILYGSILYSSKANDIDILCIAKKKQFIKIQAVLDKTQKSQIKKIHSINFTETEFKRELRRPNKALVDAVKTGIILFGQEEFIQFIKELNKNK